MNNGKPANFHIDDLIEEELSRMSLRLDELDDGGGLLRKSYSDANAQDITKIIEEKKAKQASMVVRQKDSNDLTHPSLDALIEEYERENGPIFSRAVSRQASLQASRQLSAVGGGGGAGGQRSKRGSARQSMRPSPRMSTSLDELIKELNFDSSSSTATFKNNHNSGQKNPLLKTSSNDKKLSNWPRQQQSCDAITSQTTSFKTN